ncbi:MAG: hypothetical protein ACYS47_18780 [Planctomycetota bacterium]|jgi:hypothetical protein
MKALTVFALVLSATCLAAASGVYVSLKAEVDGLDEQLELERVQEAEAREAAAPAPVPDWVPLLEARVATLEDRVDQIRRKGAESVASAGPSGEGLPGAVPAPRGDSGEAEGEADAGGAKAGPRDKKDLVKKIEELESRLGEVQKTLDEGKEDKKPKLHQFAARLGLDEHQTEATREILIRGNEELLEHMKRPRSDGSTVIDELAEGFFQVMQDPENAEKKMMPIYIRLMTQNVPGREETYGQLWQATNQRLAGEMKAIMTEEQKKKYDEWSPEPTEIEFDDNPLGHYVIDYITRRSEEEKAKEEEGR